MNVLVDMNLSPRWVEYFSTKGHHAKHWSEIGEPSASDRKLFDWARMNDYLIMTNDLDFGIILALTHSHGPSVLQIRAQDLMPHAIGHSICSILEYYKTEIETGVLITLDDQKSRARLLPIK
jgi:predicted nuclease of predicted toxin-antitoxin system